MSRKRKFLVQAVLSFRVELEAEDVSLKDMTKSISKQLSRSIEDSEEFLWAQSPTSGITRLVEL